MTSARARIVLRVSTWLENPVTLLGIPFQNWMLVAFALMLVAALINVTERR